MIARADDARPIETGYQPRVIFQHASAALGIASERADSPQKSVLLAEAVAAMQSAIKHGFRDNHYLETDPDLLPLQASSAFQDLEASLKDLGQLPK